MLLLSMTPMLIDHVDEICEDLKRQQDTGVTTCAMLMMYFAPEGTPPFEKAEHYCKIYDVFSEKLTKMGVRHGVLVQSTLGHGAPLNAEHPFQKVESLMDEEGKVKEICCPYDSNYREYIKKQMAILAKRRPSIIMIDDDVGLLYRFCKGCTCPTHMKRLSELIGKEITREELVKCVRGTSEEDMRITNAYIETHREALVGAVKAMREGIDSVDPTIQGIVSTAGNYCEFTEDIIEAFAGKGNKKIVRINNGNYTPAGARWFSKNMLRAATQKEIMGDRIDEFLAETDTCPQNRYSTGAQSLHAHMTGTILEGAKGAKHWITRTIAHEPESGRAYREILSKHRGFYEALAELEPILKPVGCRIPLSKVKDYCLTTPNIFAELLSGWASCVLERFGFPMYFSGKDGGAVFLDDKADVKFTDEQILEFFKGTLFLTAKSAMALNERGFLEYTGVKVSEWKGKRVSSELLHINGNKCAAQIGIHELVPISDEVKWDSDAIHTEIGKPDEAMFPSSTVFNNQLGGTTVVFAGTPHTNFSYSQAFSFLNESRKKQFVKILKEEGHLPVYYPGDIDVYIRAGYLPDDTLFCAMFNISLDPMFEITLSLEKAARRIEKLMPDGTKQEVEFYVKDGITHIKEPLFTLNPVILFIQ